MCIPSALSLHLEQLEELAGSDDLPRMMVHQLLLTKKVSGVKIEMIL
jgi:hypothetical protein